MSNRVSAALTILALVVGFNTSAILWYGIYPPTPIPSFLQHESDGSYTIGYLSGNCAKTLSLKWSGGIWFESGSGSCPIATSNTQVSNDTSSYQSIIDQALAQHMNACFYFFKEFNGTTTFNYSVDKNCTIWHAISVNP